MATRPTDHELARALRAVLAADPSANSYPTIRAARHAITRALSKDTLTPVERDALLEVLTLCEPHEVQALRPRIEAKTS